jgi:transcriptional regulator with XRE-family HTH domain
MSAVDELLEQARARRALPPAPVRRFLRERVGVTQAELAEVLGVERPTVTRYESGAREPRGDLRVAYAGLLERLAGEEVEGAP